MIKATDGTDELWILEFIHFWPVVNEAIPVGGPYVYTPVAPTLPTVFAVTSKVKDGVLAVKALNTLRIVRIDNV